MKMIELKYKQAGRARRQSFTLGGFELQAPHSYDFPVSGKVMTGQLSKQFRMTIPTNGLCQVPDTQFNRDRLRRLFDKKGDNINYIFEVLSDIDLKEEAPHAGGGAISQTEERDLKKQIAELQANNAKLIAESKKKQPTKTGGKAKVKEDKPVSMGEGLPELA